MAEAVVNLVITNLGDLIQNEVKFLYGVSRQVDNARLELDSMHALLKQADAVRQSQGGQVDERIRIWVGEIREAAYDLGDVIETFVLKVALRSRRRRLGLKRAMIMLLSILNKGVELRKVGLKIEEIKTRMSVLTSNLQTFGVSPDQLRIYSDDGGSGSGSGSGLGSSSFNERQGMTMRTYSHVMERDIVGFEDSVEDLVAVLLDKSANKNDNKWVEIHRVVPIWGTLGSGKTTLAKIVYHDKRVKSHFKSFAWVYVSQKFQPKDVWQRILIALASPVESERKNIVEMTAEDLTKKIYDVVKEKKCLVILDDVWKVEDWNSLKVAFPSEDDVKSKILITTRNKDVASEANGKYLCQPPPLNQYQSWELLKKKANLGDDLTNMDVQRKSELAREMLEEYSGLPLAITVLGGILSRKQTIEEWEMVHKNTKEFVYKEHGVIDKMMDVSYADLPHHLRHCFLHLAHFPEDFEIRVKELCRIWIAEGFVIQGRWSSNDDIEDAAYQYLSELVQRSMVQVETRGTTGRIKTCRVPVCMRHWFLKKAEEENFLESNIDFENKHGGSDSSSLPGLRRDQAYSSNTCKVRRLSTSANQLPQLVTYDERYNPLRSLIFFDSQRRSYNSQVLKPLFNRFNLLRVLKFEAQGRISSSQVKVKLPKEIGKLVHLRFLSLKDSEVQELPSSICDLVCLQTLDLRTTLVLEFPNVLWKLNELRHLYLPVTYKVRGARKLRLNNLSKLQSLVNVSTKDFDVDALAELTNLRKLKINLDRNVEEVFTSTSITFSHLQSLFMAITGNKLEEDPPLVRFPHNRQFFPTSLRKLTLAQTFFRVDPMAMLERRLPNLISLRLLDNAHMEDKMECSGGGFPQLRSLCISGLPNWKEWRLEEGALPSLSELKLINVCNLKEIPDGLRKLTSLNKCVIQRMPKEFIERVQKEGEDFHKLQHIASLEISDVLDC